MVDTLSNVKFDSTGNRVTASDEISSVWLKSNMVPSALVVFARHGGIHIRYSNVFKYQLHSISMAEKKAKYSYSNTFEGIQIPNIFKNTSRIPVKIFAHTCQLIIKPLKAPEDKQDISDTTKFTAHDHAFLQNQWLGNVFTPLE